MNIFKKISLFFTYRDLIINIKRELELTYNARVDGVYRIYTVLNIPEEYFEDIYDMRTSDINNISRNFINDFRRQFSQYLVSKGLLELFDLYEIRKVDKYSYLIIYGFSLFDTKKIVRNFLIGFISISTLTILFLFFYFLFKTLF